MNFYNNLYFKNILQTNTHNRKITFSFKNNLLHITLCPTNVLIKLFQKLQMLT